MSSMENPIKFGTIVEEEFFTDCFVPLGIHLASTVGAKAEWRRSERALGADRPIPKKPKKGMPLLRKKWHKVAHDDNYNYNR